MDYDNERAVCRVERVEQCLKQVAFQSQTLLNKWMIIKLLQEINVYPFAFAGEFIFDFHLRFQGCREKL